MDGLLLDSERQMYSRIGMEVSAKLNDPIDLEFLRSMMGNDWSIYRKKVAEYKGENFPIEEYMRLLNEGIAYTIANVPIPLRPGAKEVLDYCKENHYLMAIATSTHKKEAYQCLNNTGIFDYFDYISTGDEVTKGKPDPEIFLKAIAHFDVNKDEAIVLEDGHNGAQAAFKGGCRLVIVEDLAYLTDEDRQKAELHTYDIRDVIDLLRRDHEGTAGL